MSINRKLSRVGIAKQTAKGTPSANAQYAFGVRSGNVVSVDVAQEREAVTLSNSRLQPHANRGAVVPGADWASRAYPASIGLLLYAALGGISSEAGTPNTHTITPATTLPYLTLFGDLNGEIASIADCLLNELEISWDGVDPLEASASFVGCDLGFDDSFGTVTTDDALAEYFRPAGGTFQLDIDGTTLADEPIRAGSISIANGVEPIILSAAVTPDDAAPAEQTIDVGLTLVPTNLDEWQTIITGTSNGTTVRDTPLYGSFSLTFTLDASTDLVIASNRVAFLAEFPESDPGGGPAELELEGAVLLEADGGAAITATLRNDIASY